MKRFRSLAESASEDERRLATYLLAILSSVVTVAGFLAILSTESLRRWLQVHAYLIFILLVVVILIALLTFKYHIMATATHSSIRQRSRGRS